MVVLLEPDADVRALYGRALVRNGCTIVAGADTDGPAPDLIVLEPGWARGVELAREARRRNPAVRVICASIYPAVPGAGDLAPEAYFVKPVRLEVLTDAVAARPAA